MECRRGVFYHMPCWIMLLSTVLQIISALHRRFPKHYTPAAVNLLTAALAPPQRTSGLASSAALQASVPSGTGQGGAAANGPTAAQISAEQKEKEDSIRVTRQRPVLRVCAELALVGIIRDAPSRSGGEWVMKTLKDLVSVISLLVTHETIVSLLRNIALQRSVVIVFAPTFHIFEDICKAIPWNSSSNFYEISNFGRSGTRISCTDHTGESPGLPSSWEGN